MNNKIDPVFIWPITLTVIIIITFFILGIVFNNSNPEPQYAQWSENKINTCYKENNNILECYYMCRDHQWTESYCTEKHNKLKDE